MGGATTPGYRGRGRKEGVAMGKDVNVVTDTKRRREAVIREEEREVGGGGSRGSNL